jgi:hypothetical protein
MLHNRSTYVKHKCRCDICVQDAKKYRREYKLKNGGDMNIRLDPAPLITRMVSDGAIQHVHHIIWKEWVEKGITLYAADKWCIKFGYHPATVFGNAFYEGCTGDINF